MKTLIYVGIGYCVNALGLLGLALLLSHGTMTEAAIVRVVYGLLVCLVFWAAIHVQLARSVNSCANRPAIDALAPIIMIAVFSYISITLVALAIGGFIPHLKPQWEIAFHLLLFLTFARPVFAI